MDNAEIRQLICKKCIVVKGFNNEIQFHEIKKSFPESSRLNLATRTSTLASRDKEWIIQFQSVKDAQRYIQDVRILKCSEGLLDISDCELPCDIPDEWLQDEVISDKSATSPKHVSLGTLQPPPYSPSDPSVPPSQHSTSAYQFPPYDPRYASMQYGPNPQNPYQHQYYPSYGMPWNPSYHPGSSGKEHLPRDQKEQYGPQHAGQWSQYPGYYVPYGSYPGYGYPPQANFDFHQPVQQLPGQENPSQYTQGYENQGNTTYQSSSSETGKEENVVHSDGEEQIDEEKMEDEPAKASTNMLTVTKLPSDTTEDGLQFFFENTRKFGGGDVEDVEYDEDTKTAIITFEEDEAVDIVLQKIPILFNKKVIDVEAHIVGAEASSDIPEEESHDSSQNTDEPVTICSIEVRGMKENTTQDTIMYYFESKKGAKADVENIEFVEDKDMYIVTFENEEAVETVLSKSHIVDGAKLQVKRHVPLKRYPNKALVKGFSPNTTKDGIINFLEARTKFEVEEVDFGDEDSGKAIVTFCDPIDIGDIQTACKKKALDKNYLTVHPVVVTNCIVVRGFSEKTTESGLEYYFDNKRKSGVEGVTDVKMNRDDNCCVIYFENAEDALLACKRSHTIDNCTLKVQVFYDCLGVPADNEGPKFKPLPSLVITDIDKYKLSFLKNSAHKKETLEKQLEKSHSKITWPTSPQENKVIVECTITKETEDCRKLAKTWEIDTRMHIDSFVNLLVKEIHSTLQEAWGPVMQKLREIHISDPDSVTVNLENPPTCEIIITGLSDPVKEVSDKVKRIIDEVSEDLDRKKQLVQEEVSLKRHQLFILSFSHFSNKIRQEFEQMEIKIDTKKHVITFIGISGNISKAKVTMYETLSNIASAPIGKKSPGYIQFLKKQDVKKSIAAKLKSRNLIGVWEIQDNIILMYSMSDEEAVAAADILKDCVVEVKIDVDNVQKSILISQKWKQHVQAIRNEFERKSVIAEIVTNQQGQITVYCNTQGEAGIIKEKIQDFFLTNTEKKITIDLPPSLLKFLQEELKDEVENLEKNLRKRNIIVAVKSDDILVKGNAEGIKDAEDEVEALVQKIYKTKHSMDKPGLQELMNSNQGKTKLKQVSKQAGVVISSDSDEDERSSGQIRRRGGAGSDERAVFCGVGGQEVIVVKGDITGLDVDVIVNAANKDLAHRGGLAKVLVNKDGFSGQAGPISSGNIQIKIVKGELSKMRAFEDEEQNRQRRNSRQDRDYTQQPTGYQDRRGSWLSKLVICCDGRKVNIDSSCKSTSIWTDTIILFNDISSKRKNDSSRYLHALLGNKDNEFEILMTFSTLLKINLIKPEDWLVPVIEHQHEMACYMLLAYITATNTNKGVIISALKMAIEKGDKNNTNIICWFIIREYFRTVSFQIDGLLDIWPAVVCKNINCHEFVFCSKDVVIVVETLKSVTNLPIEFWNIQIVYLSQANVTEMGKQSTEQACKNTNVSLSIQNCFPEKFEIDGNLASELFEKHSKLTFICKSIYTLKDDAKVNRPCVQLFCRRKGLIPIKENHLPKFINNVKTNILEGEPMLARRIRAGEQINSKYYIGTLGGFVKVMGDITILTCAHVVVHKDIISGKKLSIPNNEATHIDCVQISPNSNDTFCCGKLRYIEFRTDRPGETSIDAALIALTEGIEIDNDDFIANRLSNKHPLKLLGMKSPFLNENCLDYEKMFYGKHFSQFYNVTIGAISSISVNGSNIDVPEDKEDGIYVDLETIIDTYNKIMQSENQQNVHSSIFSTAAPVFSNNAHTQETRLLKVDKERTHRRLSRSMYNQIAVTHIPFKPGDSGTCVYVCDNSLNAYGCMGMAIANHPGPDGGVILTPMKEILKTFHVDIQ